MKANCISKLVLFALLACLQIKGYTQSPQGISYQAVIRDGNGSPIANKTIGAKITLENALGVDYYVETQSPTSNGQGVISLIIGKGAQVGSNTFTSIPWKNGDVHVMIEIDPAGSNAYVPMGTSTPLQSVPYALYAENVKEVVSQSNATDEDPIFVVRNKEGKIVFAVYQTGVRVYVEDTAAKGTKGGFAVGGLSGQSKGEIEYFRITPDSARIFVNETPGTKGTKGGFAVGGLSGQSKVITSRDIMFIAPDSARLWVKDQAKGTKGGFAVGGLSGKGAADQFLNLTPNNYLIGHQAGKGITTGLYNSFMGYQSGQATTIGSSNVFLGYQSGYSNTSGKRNTFLGHKSGHANLSGYSNVFIGDSTGYDNSTGRFNVFVGSNTGVKNTTGIYNAFVGYQAGFNSNATYNTFMGYQSGYTNTLR